MSIQIKIIAGEEVSWLVSTSIISIWLYLSYCRPKIATFRLFSLWCCTQFPGTSFLVFFPVRVLRNSCKWCAIIIVLFTMGGVVSMETECLWLPFGVCRTQILPLARLKNVDVGNQRFQNSLNKTNKLSQPYCTEPVLISARRLV